MNGYNGQGRWVGIIIIWSLVGMYIYSLVVYIIAVSTHLVK